MSKNTLLLALALLIAAAASYRFWPQSDGSAPRSGAPAVEVETGLVEGVVLPQHLALVSNLEAWQTVTIAPEVSGRLVRLMVESGDAVAEGQILARLDDKPQRAQRDEAQAYLQEAQRQLQDRRRLANKGAISASELAAQEAEVAMAQARLLGAEAELEKRTLLAPFTGVIGLVSHAPGAQLTSGESLMTLDELQRLRLDLAVPQRYLTALQSGQRIQAQIDTYPKRQFEGALIALDSRVNPADMTVAARFEFTNAAGLLKPGMLTRVSLALPASARPVIPVQAMEYAGSDRFVYRVDEAGIAHRTQIEPGVRQGSNLAVESGLAVGDRIVIKGLVSVKDGRQVKDIGATAARSGGQGEAAR